VTLRALGYCYFLTTPRSATQGRQLNKIKEIASHRHDANGVIAMQQKYN